MLNNFCFHVYAQKSLFLCENCNMFFWTSSAREFANHRAGSQLKMTESQKLGTFFFDIPAFKPFFGRFLKIQISWNFLKNKKHP